MAPSWDYAANRGAGLLFVNPTERFATGLRAVPEAADSVCFHSEYQPRANSIFIARSPMALSPSSPAHANAQVCLCSPPVHPHDMNVTVSGCGTRNACVCAPWVPPCGIPDHDSVDRRARSPTFSSHLFMRCTLRKNPVLPLNALLIISSSLFVPPRSHLIFFSLSLCLSCPLSLHRTHVHAHTF